MSSTIQQFLKNVTFIVIQLVHLFFDCFLSQQLMNHNIAIQEHINNGKWYNTSLKAQKIASLVIRTSQVPSILTAGKLIVLSMENYGVVVKTSASYFTVMASIS